MQRKMIKFLSVLLLICTICVVFGMTRPTEADAATATKLVLKVNSEWTSDGARFAAYFFGNGEKWVSMTSQGNNVYTCSVPSGYPNVIFVRMNGGNTTNSWDNKWNQSSDLTVPADTSCMYTMKSGWWDGDVGTWGGCSHSWNSGTVTKQPTCAATGVKTYTCNWCAGTKTETIAKTTNHNYAAATCTVAKKCTVCGATSGNALGHSYSYAKNVNPTESATGSIKGTCSRCKGTTTVSLPKLNTTNYTRTQTKAPTCTATGTYSWTWKTTTYGTFTYTSSIPATGHSYGNASCSAPATCSVCKATTGSALGHNYTNYATVTAPTTSATGSIKGKCSRCTATNTVTLPKLNTTDYTRTITKAATCTATGTYSWKWKTTTYGSFTYTSTISKTAHSYAAATCTKPQTCSCGATTGNALGHNYTNYAKNVNPTTSATGSIKGTCSRCSDTNTVTVPKLNTTDYTRTTTTAATCTATGTYKWTWKTTTYGTFSWNTTIDKLSHSYAAATCTKPQTCTACGATTGSALGHSYSSKVTTAATCTAAGVRTYTCSRCSDSYTESIAATGHSYSGGKCGNCGDTKVVSVNGDFNSWSGANMTYSSSGYTYSMKLSAGTYKFKVIKDGTWLGNNGEIWDTTTATSSVGWEFADWGGDCTLVATGGTYNFTFIYDTNMLIITYTHTHAYTAGTVVAPTCTAKGYTVYTCPCGATENRDEKAATGHSYTSSVTKAATCTADGVRTYTCSKCSNSYTEAITKLGHDYKSVVTAPTCEAQGYTTHTCSRCSDTYKDTYKDALGHAYTYSVTKEPTTSASGTLTGTCSRCSSKPTVTLPKLTTTDYNYSVTKQPNCTATGTGKYTWKTTTYGSYSFTVTIAANGHNYGNASCTEAATCSVCGVSTGSALGHNYTNYSVTKAPTESATGSIQGKCSRCSATDTQTLPKLTSTNYSTSTQKAATCTADGTKRWTWKTTTYGSFYFDTTITKLGHNYSSVVTAPTCTAQGYTTYTCANCSDTYKDTYKDALGHNYSSKVTTAATCTTDGVKTFTCGNCNHSYTETIAKLGHDYKSTVTAPTCTAEGYTTYTCSRCSDTYKDNYKDALGHNYVGGKCGNCGDTKVVSLNGTFNDWAGQNMTWTESGYTLNIVLPAGTYQFKVIKDGTWLGNDGDIWDTTTATSAIGWEFVDWAGDCDLVATGGTYTFTFNFDTNFLVITNAHTHAYTAGEVVKPTCTAKGYTVYTCPCGDSYNGDEKAALGHSYSSKVTTEATCTTDGVKTFTCSTCGDTYTEVITKLGHSYSSKVTAPTCTAQGYTTHTCSRCSDSYKDSYVAALGHNYQNGACQNCGDSCDHKYTSKVTKDPTCTTDGVRTYTCSVCGGSYTEAIEKLGHSYSAVVTAPTCTAEGYTTYTCSTCGNTYKDNYKDALGHSYSSKVTTAATCTSDGVKTFTCGNCSHSYTEVIPATGHNYAGGKCGNCGDTKIVSVNGTFNDWAGQNMTWTENGYTINIVLPAGTYQFKVIKDGTWLGNDGDIQDTTTATSAIGWEFVDWAGDCDLIATGGTYTFTFNFDTNMLVIEYVHTHAYTAGEVVAPTCTAKGYTVYTCPCGDTENRDEVAALGHNHVGKVTTAATCTTDGVETFTCSRCGDSYTQVINKLGHDYKVTVTAPTCEAKGYTTHTCSRCSDSYKDSYVDALGHNFVDGSCTNCGTGCDHKYTSEVTKDPTCTADGVRTYTCSICGNSYTEAIDKLGHSYSTVVTAPTCTAQGYTTYTCGTCGDTYKADFVDALGHSYTEEVVDATCTEDGLKTFTCGNCSHSYTEVIKATGHSYVGGKCGNCGDTKIVSVNGTFNDWAGQNMTWTEGGYTFNIVLSSGTYEFKIVKDGAWMGNNGTIEDTTVKTSDIGWEFVEGDGYGNCTLIATGGTYTFTFNFDTNMLVIEYNHTHAHVAGEVVAPTCTDKGYTVYTCPCGDSYNGDEVAALGHDYKATVTTPTCTTEGYTTHTCSVCGDSYTDSYVGTIAHSFVGDTCTVCGAVREYYLFGFINGTDYAYGEQGNFLGELKFVDGKLTLIMTTDSYVAVKADDNWTWYMAESYCTDKTVVLKNTALGEHIREKMFVPAGTTVTFTLVVNTDDTLILSYVIDECEHKYDSVVTEPTCETKGYTTHTCSVCGDSYTDTETEALGHSYVGTTCTTCGHVRDYYLVGWINGADYGFNDDAANLGEYKFVGGKLVAAFTSDCYVFIKTGDNLSWYQAEGDCEEKTVILYNDELGLADPNKLFVPGGVEVTFTLVVNNDETLVLSYEITNCSHSYNEGQITKAPTCTDKGEMTYTCSICGHSYTEEIDALGHKYEAKVTAPTCTDKGYTTYTCSVCGDSYTADEVAALGHSYSEKVTDATCTEDGLKTFTCGTCGHSYTEVIPATGHNFVNGTCTNCGAADPDMKYITVYFQNNWLWTDVYAYVWTDDGPIVAWPGEKADFYANDGTYDIYYVTIPEGANVIFSGTKNDGSGASDQTADILGAQNGDCYWNVWNGENATEKDNILNIYCEHDYTGEQTKAPTCTDKGELTYTCSKCGKSYTEEIAALGHKHEAKVTEPTCTAGGYTTYTCSVCGDSYTADEVAALGHNFVDGVCQRCGEREPVTETITVYFQNNWLWTDVHAYVWTGDDAYITPWPGTPATFYANDGTYDIYCVTIPAGYKVIFNGTKNDGSGASDQTPDIEGAANGDCYWMTWVDGNAVEKDHIDNVYTPACDHSYETKITAPTCTEKGYTTYTCSKCSDSYTEEIPALGHNFVDGTCTNCGEAEPVVDYYLIGYINGADYGCNEDGDNLGIYKFVDGQLTATFASDSYVFIKTGDNRNWYMFEGYCSETSGTLYNTNSGLTDANKMFVPGGVEVTFTLTVNDNDTLTLSYVETACEHSYTEQITKAPTCTEAGIKTFTCGLCGDSYTEEISALGHSYVNGVCSVCGHSQDDNIKIHFVNTLGWQGVVGYAWKDTNGTTSSLGGIAWPGIIVQRDNEGYYTMELEYAPVSGQSIGVLFHDFSGNQTADVLIGYDLLSTSHEIWVKPATSKTGGKYDCTVSGSEGGMVISPEINGQEVTFRYAGSASGVYLAGSMNNWSTSATAMTKGEDGVWSVTLTLNPGVYEYKFVVDGSWILDPTNGHVGGYDGNSILVVPADDVTTNNGRITVVLHFYRASGDYSGWDVWYWGNGTEGAASFSADPNNKGMIATFTIDGTKNSNVGYTIRKTDWSDKEFYDRFIDLSDVVSGTVHYYVNSGVATGSRVLGEDVVSVGKLAYANYDYEASTVWVKAALPLANPIAGNFSIVDGSGNATGITVTSATLDNYGYKLTLSKPLTITQANTYKVKYESYTADIHLDTTDLFYSSKFASEYTYYGDDLGATWSRNSTTFKVWAPTALNVHVKIYDSGNYGSGNQVQYVQMTQGDKGVWSVTVPGNWHGYYYNYDVTFESYTVEATDPYARSTGANGDRGMILNLDATDPSGWANDISPNQGMSYTDAIIYELHVREFTNDSNSGVNSAWRGNYLGLTQSGTSYNGHATGLDYLKELGITHVQLMPVTDFSSVDEYHDGYAWGYDPKNFNVPEGSYSTNPFDGSVRVNEFKQMVQTLHANGINVTMDVVFNHAFDGGNFCYNQIVPNYFSRFYGEGNWSNGSGVGNDLATERSMTRNFIVDTILYWVEEYHIDGFRFDLAGLIDTQTINEVVSAVHAKHPYVMFYGEGWAAGDTAVEYGYTLATKDQAWQLGGFGFFNDDYRNGIAGNNGNSWGFASGSWDYEYALADWFKGKNTFSNTPSQTINYVSCHDNYCLTDKLLISRNGAYWEEIAKMNRLSNAIVMMSEGVPFLYSGDEMLRERKDYNGNRLENAHMGGDYSNTINWADLEYKQYANETSDYYKGLIEFRKNHAALRISDSSAQNYVTFHRISDQTVMFYISGYPNYECSDGIVVIFNASSSYTNVDLYNYGIPTGNYQAVIHGDKAGVTPLWGVDVTSNSGSVGVEGISTTVLVLGDLVHEESVYNKQPSKCGHASHNISGMCNSCGKTVDHTFVNGVCACGLSQSAPATYTVYYDNSTTNWSSVNIYAWTTTAGQTKEYAGTWSGSAMTLVDEENNIYAYELPVGAVNVIFNGDGSQTDNLNAPGYTSDATLYSNGQWIIYTGACEHSYTDSYIEEPTCILGGVVKHTCSKCDYSYTEEVEALGHDYVAEVTEATCVSGGYTTYTCSRCDDSYVDDETAALRHDYVDGICSVCGTEKAYFLFGYINGANYGSDGDEATMGIYKFVDGVLTVTFTQNSYVGVKTTDNENWYMTDGFLGEDVTSATLYDTSIGINADKLFVPGQMKITFTLVENEDGTLTLSYQAAACEHEYESVVTEPTCTEAGYTTHKCIYCGESYTDTETEALGHDFADGFCQRCGAIDPAVCEHEYGEGVVTDPTCTEGGYTTYTCTICGHSYTADETEATGHSHEAVVTEPTCTEPGYTTYTCSCGDTYTADEVDALGHDFVDGFCQRCGAVDPATCEHEYESVVTEPTCTEGGFTTNTCSICGHVEITDETEPAGHSYEAVVTEPTCTEPGYTTYTCTVCGDSYTGDETEIIDHSFVDGACENCGAIDPAVCEHSYGEGVVTEPTCTAKGYTTYTCDLCGHSYTADETEMVDHSFVDGVCENCGEPEGDTPVCEHEYVKSAADATCTEPGGDKYTCSKCGDVYYENEVAPLGHEYVNGICERCGDLKPLSTTYYLVGWINGGNHGCEEDSANMGNYKITDNMFKFTFDQTSYVFLKTEGNGKWFMCDGYPGDGVCFANLYDTSLPINHDKVNVPGGIEITFTLIERDDGSVTLTYVTAGNCSHNWYTQTQVWPGCTTTGVMLHRCIMCAESYTTTIPAKGHSFNGGSNCWDCGAANPNYTYYYQIVGWINGQNVGCEENWEQPGYQFSGNRLTMTFTENSYIYIKTHDNSKWYMTDGYPGDDATSATFYHTDSYWEIQKDKMFVPKGRTITFTLSVRSDNTIYLSYVAASCQHTYDSWMNVEATCTSDGERAYKCSKCDDYYTEVIKATGHKYSGTSCTVCGAVAPGQDQIYYLVGWINGANYGCEDDYKNMGSYKFVDGQLIVTFREDSYVYIKTQGNTAWYMTQSFVQTNSGTFYDTATGANEKMLVKAGTEYRFTLVENADGSLTLTYGPSNCTHTNVTEEVTAPTCTEKGYTTLICNDCGNREITNETEPTGHSFVDGACEHCGAIDPATCQHSYGEGTVTAPTCTAKGYTTYICTICGYEHIGDETDMIPHNFVDGICTVCGAEEDDGMITVYFQNNWLWSDVFVYYWNDNGSNAEWPGEPATWYANDGTYDIYCVTMPAGSKVIFSGTKNDGSGTSDQTPDIEDAQDGDCYYMTWNDGNAVEKDHIDNIIGECEHEYEATVTEPGCKTPGYTTHKCKLCGDEYVDTHTAPVGHNFVNDVCIVCGEAKVEENQDFYLIGYINGANYGCDEDWENLGIYKFVDGKLVAHFKSDSYVFVKTGDNLGWYMTEGFGGTEIPYAELFNTNIGLTDANKLFVPGGMKITFVLVRTGEDTFILGYTVSECEHPEHTVTGKCVYCGEAVEHDYQITVNDYTCTEMGGVVHTCACGASYVTDTVPASGHNFVDGICVNCGIADESGCAHEFELTVDPGKCNLSAYTVNTCKLCGHTFNVYNDANMDWTMVKPVDVHESLLITKPMYSYRDRETTTADTDTLEGWELIGSELIDEELGTYLYTFQRWTEWTDWSDEEVTASEDREVQTATAYRFAEGIIGEHEYVEVVTDPTCTEMGYTTVTCSICGESYIYNYTDALGHSYEAVVTAPGCTTQGYTTHTCSVCGDSYNDSYTDPTGHSFTDGQCECGAYALQALSLSLTLESEVKYNLYFSLNDPAIQLQNVGLLTFKSQPTEATLENADFVLDTMVFDANFNCNAMRSQGIPAKEMGDTLYMRLYATMDDGTVIYGKLISYSAKTFATNTLNRASSSETLKNTVVALMNYGAEAQKLFGYKTDSLMNADIPAEYQDQQIAYSADLLDGVIKADSAKVGSLTATAGAFNGASAQVTLDGALAINFLFLPGKTVDGGKMTMYYWSAGTYASVEELTLDNADGSVETTINGSLYQGIYDGIAAKEMDDTVYVLAVYESDGETCLSGIVSYSIEQFCRSQVSKATQNTALCEKLTIYSYYTKVYFNVD